MNDFQGPWTARPRPWPWGTKPGRELAGRKGREERLLSSSEGLVEAMPGESELVLMAGCAVAGTQQPLRPPQAVVF
jgi:hypothetical protein